MKLLRLTDNELLLLREIVSDRAILTMTAPMLKARVPDCAATLKSLLDKVAVDAPVELTQ